MGVLDACAFAGDGAATQYHVFHGDKISASVYGSTKTATRARALAFSAIQPAIEACEALQEWCTAGSDVSYTIGGPMERAVKKSAKAIAIMKGESNA